MLAAQLTLNLATGCGRIAPPLAFLRRLGFAEQHRGSHVILSHSGIPEILNLQPLAGGRAKPYQVKQVRRLLIKYGFAGAADHE